MATFRRKNLVTLLYRTRRNRILKGLTLFFLGASATLLLVNADVVINPLVSNSVSFLKKIVLTSDGTSTSATGVFLDGSTSKIGANYICNAAGTGCKAYTSLALPTCKDYQMLKYSGSDGWMCNDEVAGMTRLSVRNARSMAGTGGTERIFLDGLTSKIGADNYCNLSGTGCTTWDNLVQNSQLGYLATFSSDCAVGSTLVNQGDGTWDCGTISTSGGVSTELDPVRTADKPSYVTSSSLTTALAAKADTSTMNTALAAKADTSTMNTALAAKADTSTMNTALAAKADISALHSHANTGYLNVINQNLATTNSVTFVQVNAGEFIYTSDKRLKKNIVSLGSGLEQILSLTGYSFDWRKDGKHSIGLIAQEIEKVFPQLVSTASNGYKAVSYGNIVAPLIESVKSLYMKYVDQQQQIDDLKDVVSELTWEIEALKNRR